LIAAGDFVTVDPKSDFAVDSADVVEVPVGGWVAEVTFGEASGSVGRKGWEGFEFGFADGEDIAVGGEPGGFFTGALFVEFGVSMIEDLDFDSGVWESIRDETFEGFIGGPEEESGVPAVGEVSPPADEFKVSVFFLGSQDADRIAGAVDKWAVPSPGVFVAVCALEIVFAEFDPTISGCIDLNR